MLHYQFSKGDKIALVFLHGYCEDLSMWTPFVDTFQEHLVLKVDLPGFGKSPTSDDLTIYKMAQEVDQVIKHLEIEKLILIGHSMGGYVSIALSKLLGDALQGICMMHTHPFEDLPETKEKRTKANAFIKEHGVPRFLESLAPNFFASELAGKYTSIVRGIIDKASKLPSEALINGMNAMRDRPDRRDWVVELKCPYHCVLGTEDIPTPLDFCLPQINLAKITKVTILDGVGHMGMFSVYKDGHDACRFTYRNSPIACSLLLWIGYLGR